MAGVDLHVHSTASDGRLSPADVVYKSAELGVTIIALADHDSVDGIAPALAAAEAFPQLKVMPAVEISTDVAQGEVHVLGYFIDYTDHELRAKLEKFRDSREKGAQGMIDKLRNLGVSIDWRRVKEIAGSGSMGRPHIAQAMLEKGYIGSFKEAFTRYISRNGPAYVEREKMTPSEAVELILQAKGLPVLAHPFTVDAPEIMVAELVTAGLVGIETYYAGYTDSEISKLLALAAKHNLIATGGTDFHGLDIDTETMIGGVDVPVESAERLIALAERRSSESML